MKKILLPIFIGGLILVFVACSDSDDDNGGGDSDTTVTVVTEAKFDESVDKTITLTNPLSKEAIVRFYGMDSLNQGSFTIKEDKCNFVKDNYMYTTTLPAGGSCNIVYTFTPNKFATELIKFDVFYQIPHNIICPNTEKVPSYDELISSSKYVDYILYNYTINDRGKKSSDVINIDMGTITDKYNESTDRYEVLNSTVTAQEFSI